MKNRKTGLFFSLAFSLFVSGQTEASFPIFNLTSIVEASDLVAQGTLVFNDCTDHCVFQFVPAKIFKGEVSDDKKIMVCSFPRPGVDPGAEEWIDMRNYKGEIIIFSLKEGGCYRPLGRYVNIVRTATRTDGTIDASGIRGEPLRQTLKEFQDKIEKEVRKNPTKK